MKNDNLKRNDVSPTTVSGVFTASSVVVTNLSVSGPVRGDLQIVDAGRLIVGNDPDGGSRGILAPTALLGYGMDGTNTFALWFASIQGHVAGDFHVGDLSGSHLRYRQADGTLGLYTSSGAGIIFDNDGSFTAGDTASGHLKWDAASGSLKIMSGTEVMAEFMADGSAALGRMTLRDMLMAGDTDGPSITLGKLVTGGVESAEIIATDNANNPWLHVVAGGSTPNGGYFSLGQQGDYAQRLTYDGDNLIVNGVVIAGPGSQFGDMLVDGTGSAIKSSSKQPELSTGVGATVDDVIAALQSLGLVKQA